MYAWTPFALGEWIAFAGGAALFVWLLVLMHKRLRIFTRGTVTFIATVLMITTVISLIMLGSDVRKAERRARARAAEGVIADFTRAWFENRLGDVAPLIAVGHRDAIESSALGALDKTARELRAGEDGDADFSACRVVCISTDRYWGFPVLFELNNRQTQRYRVYAIFARDTRMALVEGHVTCDNDDGQTYRITEAVATKVNAKVSLRECRKLYNYADVFQNPEYASLMK